MEVGGAEDVGNCRVGTGGCDDEGGCGADVGKPVNWG